MNAVKESSSELSLIEQALQANSTSVLGADGYRRFMYARCPDDETVAAVYKTETVTGAQGSAIRRVQFKCPSCARVFEAGAKEIFLR